MPRAALKFTGQADLRPTQTGADRLFAKNRLKCGRPLTSCWPLLPTDVIRNCNCVLKNKLGARLIAHGVAAFPTFVWCCSCSAFHLRYGDPRGWLPAIVLGLMPDLGCVLLRNSAQSDHQVTSQPTACSSGAHGGRAAWWRWQQKELRVFQVNDVGKLEECARMLQLRRL